MFSISNMWTDIKKFAHGGGVRCLRDAFLLTPDEVNEVRDHFGDEVGFYFAFMNHWTQWLLFPVVFGIIGQIVKHYAPITYWELTPWWVLCLALS